jgi:flagellar hook-associated protein 2
VTLALTKEDVTKTANVSVKRDTAGVVKTIEKFTTAYNDIITFFKDQTTAAVAGKASIGRDPILRGLRDSLRQALGAEYTNGDGTARLPSVGVEFDSTGKLKVNKKQLEEALKISSSSVQHLFSGADGTGGAFGAIKTMLGQYTKSGGIVATVRESLGQQVSNLSRRLDTMESRLAVRRNSLSQEYIAADMAMTQLKAQSSSLSAIGSQYRLF